MLHSTLPRAFLPAPGLCYFGGYYGESVQPYNSMARLVPLENHHSYAAAMSHHHQLHAPAISSSQLARSVSPSPLDLSLKPPPDSGQLAEPAAANTQHAKDESESIDVDDVSDKAAYSNHWQGNLPPGTGHGGETLNSTASYSIYEADTFNNTEGFYQIKESSANIVYSAEGSSHSNDYQSPSSSPISLQQRHLTTPGHKNNPSNSNNNNSQNYQQLLVTPPHVQNVHASPMTPPSTPSPPQCPRRRFREHDEEHSNAPKTPTTTATPKSASCSSSSSSSSSSSASPPYDKRPKKKHARRLKFDEDTSSPVSGTVILGPDEAVVTGDIDPAFNIVEVTEEARAELAKIENRLGPYQCKLCRHLHEDAFQLAQHRCSRIAHVEYRCPECDKRFSCPANLASHRRWHKPRVSQAADTTMPNSSPADSISCTKCDAKFSRQATLRKHLVTQHPEANNNLSLINSNGTSNNTNNTNNNVDGNICTEVKTTAEMA